MAMQLLLIRPVTDQRDLEHVNDPCSSLLFWGLVTLFVSANERQWKRMTVVTAVVLK